MKYIGMAFFALGLTLNAGATLGQPPAPDPKILIDQNVLKAIHEWADQEIVSLSILAQNKRLGDLTEERILQLDKQWRAEREVADKPLISATLSSPLSLYLSRVQGRSVGLYAEIFVMDKNGLNVGQSSITSDFWQGDEAKFQKTYDVGPDAVFIDEAEWDKDFNIWRAQVSYTLVDKTTKQKIGAITIELNLTELARRQAA